MKKTIVVVDGVAFYVHVVPVTRRGEVVSFTVAAFERVKKDAPGQTFMHHILDSTPSRYVR